MRSALVSVSTAMKMSGRMAPPPYTMRPRSVLKVCVESTAAVSGAVSSANACVSWSSSSFLLRWMVRPLEQERSEEHTSGLQSHSDLVCRLLLEYENDSD